MTVYQAEIDAALEILEDAGQDVTVRRTADSEATYSEDDFGAVSASGDTFTFGSGDLTQAVSVGDTVEFREVGSFANRGPWEVTDVTSTTVTVDGSLEDDTDSEWYMDVTASEDITGTSKGVQLPPQSATGHQFEQAFRDGTLQISQAQDVIIAAKGLGMIPRPGDEVEIGGETWHVHGIGAVQPDGEPIIHQGVIYRG